MPRRRSGPRARLSAGAVRAGHPDRVIEIDGLTKAYRSRVAVDDLTVTVEPGRVTGFLGPNGSGKTTTMRCILGLTRPTAGTATVLGRPYRELAQPMRRVRPRMQRIVVVLPEPLGPRKPVTRPGSTVTVRSSTATRDR